MQQDHRLALPESGIPDFYAVHRRQAALGGLRQDGRRRQGEPLRLGARGGDATKERRQTGQKFDEAHMRFPRLARKRQ